MGLDEALLASEDDRPTLRLYGWRPAGLSLGWFQPVEPFVPLARSVGAELVRRPTGGGAIHHDDELTFSVIATAGRDGYPGDTVAAYEVVHGLLAEALAPLGPRLAPRGGDAPLSVRPRAASLCFADHTALDLLDGQGRKVVGSAQRRRNGRVLHHGSIPLTAPALTPEVGCLGDLAGRPVSWGEAAEIVTRAFATTLCGAGLVPSEVGDDEWCRARVIAEERRLG